MNRNRGDCAELERELERTRTELRILYEITMALRANMQLEEILYMVLAAITSQKGLGFERAMLFLVDERRGKVDGSMAMERWNAGGIPHSEVEEDGLTEVLSSFEEWLAAADKSFYDRVRRVSLPLDEEKGGIIARTCMEGMVYEITTPHLREKVKDEVLEELGCATFVSVPIFARSRTLGAIVADSGDGCKEISKDDVRMLVMLANQAGRAIDNYHLYQQTLRMAKTDSLTGLWNHATMHELLEEEMKRCKKVGKPLSVLMIDIDHFKAYNDVAGHVRGDAVLRAVSGVIRRAAAGEGGEAARYGGEEFLVILPGISRQRAFEVAEGIRIAVEKEDFDKEELLKGGQITVSIGVACWPEDAASKDDLISKADMALYAAKRGGRNRTRMASL